MPKNKVLTLYQKAKICEMSLKPVHEGKKPLQCEICDKIFRKFCHIAFHLRKYIHIRNCIVRGRSLKTPFLDLPRF